MIAQRHPSQASKLSTRFSIHLKGVESVSHGSVHLFLSHFVCDARVIRLKLSGDIFRSLNNQRHHGEDFRSKSQLGGPTRYNEEAESRLEQGGLKQAQVI